MMDGHLVLDRRAGMRTTSRQMSLEAGFHDLVVDYAQFGGGYMLNVAWAPAGQDARPFDPDTLFPARLTEGALVVHRRLVTLRSLVPVAWLAPPILLIAVVLAPLVPRERRWHLAAFLLLMAVWGYYGWPSYTHHPSA